MTTVRISTSFFEGPLDLLLALIRSKELPISALSISKVTNQYLEAIQALKNLEIDLASEFLVMAATLLYWKSRTLLPQEQIEPLSEEDGLFPLTPEELAEKLRTRKFFLKMAFFLSNCIILGIDTFYRKTSSLPRKTFWKSREMTELVMSYQKVLIRRKSTYHVLKKETVSVSEKIAFFSKKLPLNALYPFDQLLQKDAVSEKVATFLAILETTRLQKIKAYQKAVFEMIYLKRLCDFDPKLLESETFSLSHNQGATTHV